MRDADPVRGLPALVADLGVRGLWAVQTEALLDIRVMDTDAQSYSIVALLILFSYQLSYLDAVEARHASFSPFVTSIDGVPACEANSNMKLLAINIPLKCGKTIK